MTKKTYAIGDIHGEREALETLIDALDLQPEDELIFLGDYVDRGPDSKGVIDFLNVLKTKHQCYFVKGNHEVMMERALTNEVPYSESPWEKYGGQKTLDSYDADDREDLQASLPKAHREFLENTVSVVRTGRYVFTHAGWETNKSPAHQEEQVLRWNFLRADTPSHPSAKKVICGHSTMNTGKPAVKDNITCIDTIEKGWLTAYNITDDCFIQASTSGEIRRFDQAEIYDEATHLPAHARKHLIKNPKFTP